MKYWKLSVFSALTLIIIVVAIFFAKSYAPQRKIEKILLFPELSSRINDVRSIQVDNGNGDPVLLKQHEEQWVVQSADHYPAKFEKIKETVIGLSEFKILATKTSNPELYAELGVASIDGTDSDSKLLRFSDDANMVVAELIVGKSRKGGRGQAHTYVRKPDAKHALLVDGSLFLGVNHYDWYEREVLDIVASRVESVNVVKQDQQLLISKSGKGDTELKVIKGDTDAPTALLDKLGTFLEGMHVDGIKVADGFEFPQDSMVVTFKTFNGLVVTVKSVLKDMKPWVNFSFATMTIPEELVQAEDSKNEEDTAGTEEEDSAMSESERLNEALSAWVYQIPDFKFEALDINIAKPVK